MQSGGRRRLLSKNAKVIQSVRGPEKVREKGDPESNDGINLKWMNSHNPIFWSLGGLFILCGLGYPVLGLNGGPGILPLFPPRVSPLGWRPYPQISAHPGPLLCCVLSSLSHVKWALIMHKTKLRSSLLLCDYELLFILSSSLLFLDIWTCCNYDHSGIFIYWNLKYFEFTTF